LSRNTISTSRYCKPYPDDMTDTPNAAREAAREVAESLCLAIVNDVELAAEVWDTLAPVLRMLTVLAHRELLTRRTVSGTTFMEEWPDSLTRERSPQEIERMVRNVVRDYVSESLGLQ